MRILVALPLLTLLLARSVGGSLVLAPSPPPAAQPPAQSTSAVLIGLTKRVVKAAAKLGIDEAAGRVLGPTVWKYAKAMIEPLYDELERRFPALQLTNTPQADAAAAEATATLDSDARLQSLLLDRFSRLEDGQAQLFIELDYFLREDGTVWADLVGSGSLFRIGSWMLE